MAGSPVKIVGSSSKAASIRGRRDCGFSRREIGRRKCRWEESRTRKYSPGDQVRATASVEYTKPMPGGSWASSVIWGRNHDTATGHNLNSYLAESALPLSRKNFLTGRIELVDKDELFEDDPEIEQNLDILYGSTFRIGAYTIGYTRDVDLFRNVETGIGANFTTYSLPGAIKPYYGDRPVGGNIFIRFRLRPSEH